MKVDYRRVDHPNDKWRHRGVTLFVFVVAIAIYAVMRFGWLGPIIQDFATLYLVLAIAVLAVRAILTEAGFRRRT